MGNLLDTKPKWEKQKIGQLAFPALLLLLILILTACGDEKTSTAANSGASSCTPSANVPAVSNNSPAPATTTIVGATNAVPTETPLPVPTVGVNASVRQQLDTVASQAAQVRGLAFKQPVPISFMTRDALGQYQLASFQHDNPPLQLEQTTKELTVLGFVKPGYDLTQAETKLLTEQILGFYDDETKQFYVVLDQANSNQASALVRFTTEHELTHGLQDQYFNLLKIRPNRKPSDITWNDDYDNAVTGLIEGDAVTSQLTWVQNGFLDNNGLTELQKEEGQFSQTEINSAPPILSDVLQFPYDAGLKFVQSLCARGGWGAVNAAWTNGLPQSTSQILHPDKYFNHVAPVKVEMPTLTDQLGNGWKVIDLNTLGELQARVWLEGPDKKITPPTEAASDVGGWAGDRYEVVSDPTGNYGYAFRSQWESEDSAKTFFNATLKYLQATYGLTGDGGNGQSRSWQTSTQNVALLQKGTGVLVVVLPKGDAINQVLSAIGF